MTREEFEKLYTPSQLEGLIQTAFELLGRNKNLDLQLKHINIKEIYDEEDKTTECRVEVYYYNGHEVHNRTLIEMLFTQDWISTDVSSGADKLKDKRKKLILRIAWRIWRHELQATR